MDKAAQERIERISLLRQDTSGMRLGKALSLVAGRADARLQLDSTGLRTKILGSPDLEIQLRGYVTRRVICAGRLLCLLQLLREPAGHLPKLGAVPARWSVEHTGAVVQLTTSIGRRGFTQACHTAPAHLLVHGHHPWTLARPPLLKIELVAWFADIYLMPDTVNETDSYIEAQLDNRGLFVEAAAQVLQGVAPLDALAHHMTTLAQRIAACDEYLRHAPHKDWTLGVHLHAIGPALALAGKALPAYVQELRQRMGLRE